MWYVLFSAPYRRQKSVQLLVALATALFSLLFTSQTLAQTQVVPPSFNYQGRLLDSTGTVALTGFADIQFEIWDPGAACLLYVQTNLNVNLHADGLYSIPVGTVQGAGTRGGSIIALADPNLDMATVFLDKSTPTLVRAAGANCGGGYSSTATDARLLRVTVRSPATVGAISILSPDQQINSVPWAVQAETLQGIPAGGFIQTSATITQPNLTTLTDGSDAGGLHNHDIHNDARYARLGVTDTLTNDLIVNGKVGIGAAPVGDLDIIKPAPDVRITGNANAGNSTKLDFYGGPGGAVNTASISSQDNANILNFSTGGIQALQLTNAQGAIFAGSASFGGTIGPGQYTTAGTEPALLAALGGMGAAAKGYMWTNITSNTLRYWDGAAPQTIASTGSMVSSVTAGTGLNNSGTATDPILNVIYGSGAGQAIQGNTSFTGDVSGIYTTTSVDKIKGVTVSVAGLGAGQALVYNGAQFQPFTVGDFLANGTVSMTGDFNGGGHNITNVANQTLAGFIDETAIAAPGLSALTHGRIYFDSGTNTFKVSQNGGAYSDLATTATLGGYVTTDGLTSMSADWSIGNHKITNLTDPTNPQDAATKNYVDTNFATTGSLGSYVKINGTTPLTANWGVGGFQLNNVADPTAAQDAATKNYVDTKLISKTLPAAPGAGQAGQSLRWNNGLNTWEYFTAGAGGGDFMANGTVAATGNFNLGANKITNMADGTVNTDAATFGQVGTMISAAGGSYITKDGLTSMTADWSIGNHKITNLTDPAAGSQEAATAHYVDAAITGLSIGNYVKKDGTVAMTGDFDVGTHKIVNLVDPTNPQDAATKNYTDTTFVAKDGSTVMTGGLKFMTWTTVGRPGAPVTGQTGFNTTTGYLESWTGAAWVDYSAGAGGSLSGAGTANKVSKYTGATTLGDSGITDTGALITLGSAAAISGALDMSTHVINNVVDPTLAQDAATKNYVDTKLITKNLPAAPGAGQAGQSLRWNNGLNTWEFFTAGTGSGDFMANGTVAATGNFNLGANKITNMADGTVNTDAATFGQVGTMISTAGASYITKDGLTAMTADWSIGNHKITNLTDPAAGSQEAATAHYVDAAITGLSIGNYVKKDGTVAMTGAFDVGTHKIVNLVDPTNPQDAATKNYVDTSFVPLDGSVAMTGGLKFMTWTTVGRPGAPVTGQTGFNTTTGYLESWTGAAWVDYSAGAGGSLSGAGTNNKVSKYTGATTLGDSGITDTGALITLGSAAAISGALDMSTHVINNVVDPTNPQDAATKNYVDTKFITKTLPAAPGAGQAGQSLRWNNGLNTWEFFTAGTGSGDFMANGTVAATGNFNLGANKITNMADGTVNTDAATFGQVGTMISTAGASYITKDGLTAMTADWSIGNHKITNLTDPSAGSQEAATAHYVDAAVTALSIGSYVKKDGTVAMTGAFDVGTHKIVNLVDPTAGSQEAATAHYVDAAITAGTGSYVLKAGDAMTGALSITTPDGLNSTNAIMSIINNDVTNGESNGLLIKAGNNGTDKTLEVDDRSANPLMQLGGTGILTLAGSAGQIKFTNTNPVIGSTSVAAGSNLKITGGGSTDGSLILQSTNSAGVSDYISLAVGNNGATEGLRVDHSGAIIYPGLAGPAVSAAGTGRIYFDSGSHTFKISQDTGAYVDLLPSGGAVGGSGTLNKIPRWSAASTLADSGITDDGTFITATRSIAAITNAPAASAVDLSKSNTFTLASPGATITLSNFTDGGEYNIIVSDTTVRTYTIACTGTTYYKPAQAPTTAASRTVFGVLAVKNGANYDCYVAWSSGFQ